MADYNRNQDNQFDQSGAGWNQNRRRFDQESDYNRNRENYGSFGNTGMGSEWGQGGQGSYSGTSSGYGAQQGRRGMSDYEEQRGRYGRHDSAHGREMENMGGYEQMGGDYGREYRSSAGSGGMGSREGYQDWQRSNYGGGYGRDERQGYGGGTSDYRRGYEGESYGEMSGRTMGSMGGGRTYGEIYGGNLEERERITNQARGGRENIMANRGRQEGMYGDMRDEEYRSSGRYGGYGSEYGRGRYGQMSGGYGEMDRGRRTGEYGVGGERRDWDQRDYGRMDRDRDRNWWDRTRDEVSSWFGDEDAERRRIMDERRSESYRGRGPRDYKRSDERIREDVCDRLSDDPFIDASDIEVRVEGSEVILSGRVESREAKRRAEDMVESISGVSNVQNQLKVSRDTSSTTGSTEANR